jgi:CheY-like chemotaxis protein
MLAVDRDQTVSPGQGQLVVDRIVQRFAGELTYLRLIEETALQSCLEAIRSESPNASLRGVLVVEDDSSIRLFVSEYLRHCGFRVLEAADADDAIDNMKFEARNICIVVSDIRLPGGMDGVELAHWIGSYAPGTPVILTSGYIGSTARAMNAYWTRDVLEKPYSNFELLRRIRSALGDTVQRPVYRGPGRSAPQPSASGPREEDSRVCGTPR